MGTQCEIQLISAEHKQAKRIADIVIADVQRLEGLYSRYKPDSLLSRINKAAAKGGHITVDAETAGLLNYAATCYQQSDGLFDITSGILRQAWRFESGQLPDEQLIKTLLKKVGWHKLRWQAPLLEFPLAGMELDFGGIVKEYAVDRAAVIAQNAGARHGLINLGGDIKLIGPRPDGAAWQVGIHHPRQRQALASTLALHNGAVASSGDYERCIIVNGQRYGHILNPKTGWPVRHLASVSVVGEFCVVAGSASTIAMLKEEQGPSWLEQLELPYLWIDVHGNSGGSLANRI
ncbi:FAD:protein FMN transferase [Methylomonas sp. MO1]|uniref:FAD:protein FMN transferase n=1 Tax=unclassified Methylomonas TaxID=2608980 RepID=UPI00047EF330|nr:MULTISPECIES: FAD:protein FMN transferase [unclassified Methylomonas]MDT4292319.1 FAD:protein FMN transferase [Methylomonas sp. MO1]